MPQIEEITQARMDELLKTMIAIHVNLSIGQDDIIAGVCEALQIKIGALTTPTRSNELAEARFIIYKLLKQYTRLTYRLVGDLFNRDYSTIMYGIEQFNTLLQTKDKSFLQKLEAVNQALPELDVISPFARKKEPKKGGYMRIEANKNSYRGHPITKNVSPNR